jgi:hypothetical protein
MSLRISIATVFVAMVISLGACSSKITKNTFPCLPNTNIKLSHGQRPKDAVLCPGDTITWSHATSEFTVDFPDGTPFSAANYSSSNKQKKSGGAGTGVDQMCYRYTVTETTEGKAITNLPDGHVIVLGGGGPAPNPAPNATPTN